MNASALLALEGLPQAQKPNHAIASGDGSFVRTIWGYFLPEDVDIIAREYPEVPRDFIEEIAVVKDDSDIEVIGAPRLLEVMTVVELLARALRGEWSTVKRGLPEGLQIVTNPLSILSVIGDHVVRVVTHETELMHKAAEKVALRVGAVERINQLLDQRFGLQLAYGCSCCALMIPTDQVEAALGSDYYRKREQMGRHFDSDVLAATGCLYGPVPVGDVPQPFFDGSVDFGEAEVISYQRFARVAQACIDEHPDNVVHLNQWFNRAACFVGGTCRSGGTHCPVPPTDMQSA